jgi:8-oxo-dGTP pyrophosphatase MutT (NUDIX family)
VDVTWDGRPVAPENPRGSSIIVWRRAAASPEFLILHRAAAGPPEFEGDWAWTPPSGARQPGEGVEDAALRELREETGLELTCERTELGTEEWLVFVAEAPALAEVALDEEHDRYLWLPAHEAAAKCLPQSVGASILAVERFVADR